MILYKIKFKHFTKKSNQEGIFGYFIAENDNQVFLYMCKEVVPHWSDLISEDYFNESETQEKIKKIMEHKGNKFETPSELYYGFYHWWWERISDVNDEEIDLLERLLNAKDLHKEAFNNYKIFIELCKEMNSGQEGFYKLVKTKMHEYNVYLTDITVFVHRKDEILEIQKKDDSILSKGKHIKRMNRKSDDPIEAMKIAVKETEYKNNTQDYISNWSGEIKF